jgi:hypothetical protein
MCEVCAVFGIGRHWTDAASRADLRLPAPDIVDYRTERRRRIALLNALIGRHGLDVSDWDGESFWVAHSSGRGERARDLAEVWPIAERLALVALDPLDADFASR